MTLSKRIAVVLCGSGYKDGSEIRESVAALWALSASGVEAKCFAPDALQHDVVNCLTGHAMHGESRNMLIESARIARGQVRPLSELAMRDFHALVIPGGFGVAKNLCDFAAKGSKGSVLPEFKRVLEEAMTARKPIGAICIAPAAVGMVFTNKSLKLTLGDENDAAKEVVKLGHIVEVCAANEICVDETHRLVTTPAYMHDNAPIHEIFSGIEALVKKVVSWA